MPVGSRGNGCYLLGVIFTCAQKIFEPLEPFGARDLRDRSGEDRVGPL